MFSLFKFTMLNSKKFINFIMIYFLLIIGLTLVIFTVHYIAYTSLYNKHKKVVNNNTSPDYICLKIRCTNILHKDNYKSDNIYFYMDKDHNLVYKKDDYVYLINIKELTEYQYILLINFWIFFTIFYIILGTLYAVHKHKESLGIELHYKKLAEVKLQTELTESLHHELGIPIAIIDTLLLDLYTKMYMKDTGKMFSIEMIPELKTHYKRSVDKVAFEHYENIMAATDRIKAILKLISNNKHIKYNNGTVSLFKIFSNICNSINGFRLTKFKAEFVNQDLMEKYATGYGLDNGLHMNIINIMVTNSLEAGADKIIFRTEYLNDKFILLYITDNGIGIRDKNNNIIASNEIFNYGYTIKENTITKGKKDCRFICKIIRLMFNLNNNSYQTTRGIGLSLVKNILTKANGYVKIKSTSNEGTTFELKIPIKPRLEKHVD